MVFGLLYAAWLFIRGPRAFYRDKIKLPLIRFVSDTVDLYKSRTRKGLTGAKDVLFRGGIVASVTSVLVWISIFMYLSFYYMYVPVVSHERPVHLQFKACDDRKGLCSFPSAHVELTKRQQLLMLGQPYRVQMELVMPESPANKQLGMFMVCADFRGRDGLLVASSCRSAMLHYRSWITEYLNTLAFSPMYILGSFEEKQRVYIELFADYEEQEESAVTDVYVEVQSRHIELYSARFLIEAHFTGLRYVMFYWPVLSAAIGITSNLFFIAVVCILSWYQLLHSEEYSKYVEMKNRRRSSDAPDYSLAKAKAIEDYDNASSNSSSSSLDEDTSVIQEAEVTRTLRRRMLEEAGAGGEQRVEAMLADVY